MDLSAARALFATHGVHTIKIGRADLDGAYRGKRIPAALFLEGVEQGFAQRDVMVGYRGSRLTTNAKRLLLLPDNDGPGGKRTGMWLEKGETDETKKGKEEDTA